MSSYCDAWETGIQEPEDEFSPCVMFSIQFFVTFNRYLVNEDEVEDEILDSSTLEYMFSAERDRLIDDNTSRTEIDGMLSAMQVPVEPFMIDRILNCAHTMASNKCYMNHKVLRMNVTIFVDSYDIVPASRESIEKLATVEVKDSVKECAICLEELLVGSEAKCMPCSQLHLFHDNCIVKWLEKSKSCPLCQS